MLHDCDSEVLYSGSLSSIVPPWRVSLVFHRGIMCQRKIFLCRQLPLEKLHFTAHKKYCTNNKDMHIVGVLPRHDPFLYKHTKFLEIFNHSVKGDKLRTAEVLFLTSHVDHGDLSSDTLAPQLASLLVDMAWRCCCQVIDLPCRCLQNETDAGEVTKTEAVTTRSECHWITSHVPPRPLILKRVDSSCL